MAWLFTCECGVQFTVPQGQQRISCPKCRHVLVVHKSESQAPAKTKTSSRLLLALAGILLLLLCLYFAFQRSGGEGREALIGASVLDGDAMALAPGERTLQLRPDVASAGNIGGDMEGGTWKIVEKNGQKLTVELSSPGELPDRLEIIVRDADNLQLILPGKPGSLEQRRPVPGLLRPSKRTDHPGAQPTRVGSSSQQNANYSLIEARLYQGGSVSEPPPGTQAVINLCEKLDGYWRTIPSYLWVPIADAAPAPSLDWLKDIVGIVAEKRRQGQTIYVHCRAGISRSGMVVTAYCMFEHHWTRDQALKFVRSKRPVTQPNPAFMNLLSEWEVYLRKHSSAGGPRRRLVTESCESEMLMPAGVCLIRPNVLLGTCASH